MNEDTIYPNNKVVSPAVQYIELPGDYGSADFILRRGGKLKDVNVAYESWGELNDNHDNVVIILTGLSASTHACSSEADTSAGWWEYMIGPDKAIDTNRFHVICFNSLGGCFGTTGPSSINPDTDKPYGLDFPEVTIEDIAKAAHHALVEMGIEHIHAVIGASMGGMSALAYALQYPEEVCHLVSISAAARALPFTIAMRSLQREIVRNDPNWNGGHYYDADARDGKPKQGMLMARKLGLMSYRAAEEWHQRFDRARLKGDKKSEELFGIEFEIESYLDYNAHKFSELFDANSYLFLSRAMDLFDVADHGGTVNAGLAKVLAMKSLIIGVPTDILFPVEQQRELAEGLGKSGREVIYKELDSIYGHDSFLIDKERFAPAIREFLDNTECHSSQELNALYPESC